MAFWARTVEDISKGNVSGGAIVTVDGVTFGPRMKCYAGVPDATHKALVDNKGRAFGAPTRSQLADDRLWIETLTGLPWPGSSCDRHAKGKCADAMANALAGAKSPFGQWPDERERVVQSNYHYAREKPVERAEKLVAQRPYSAAEKVTIFNRAASMAAGADPDAFETDAIDLESLPTPGQAPERQPEQASGRRRAAAG